MNWLVTTWNWLDGKKTKIGAAILFVAVFMRQVILGIWGVDIWGFLPRIVDTLDWIGMALSTTGTIHKGAKLYVGVRSPDVGEGEGNNP
jgi:hypothetical protein